MCNMKWGIFYYNNRYILTTFVECSQLMLIQEPLIVSQEEWGILVLNVILKVSHEKYENAVS